MDSQNSRDLLVVPVIRIIVDGDLYWGVPYLGTLPYAACFVYHLSFGSLDCEICVRELLPNKGG